MARIEALAPRRIIISPGPGAPRDAGVSNDVIRAFAGRIPLFGVCLGGLAVRRLFVVWRVALTGVDRGRSVVHGGVVVAYLYAGYPLYVGVSGLSIPAK